MDGFLQSQINKKTEKEQKQLEKATEEGDQSKITELNEKISEVRDKFNKQAWLEDAANRMARQLSFGTHISKGVHPDAKGDNIAFVPQHVLAKHIVGTHSIKSDFIDANGNAAALPLAAFFDFELSGEGEPTLKIRDLILANNADFIQSLSSDQNIANEYHQIFKNALQSQISNPVTHERNKQTLWPTNAYSSISLNELEYKTLIPLYPSVFTHEVYQSINHLRYSDENKEARDNRFKKTVDHKPYISMLDLATLQLGGTKPQNVSLLMSKQGGRNYLLPSLPPMIEWSYSFNLSKFTKSIFASKSLHYHSSNAIQEIFNVVKSKSNNVDLRNERKDAIDAILNILFSIADDLRTNKSAGWSKDFDLDIEEKLWLDPMRADLPEEDDFTYKRENTDWDKVIIARFANWINALLKDEFKDIKHAFAGAEHNEWEREIEDMRKRYERAGKGVFL